MGKLFEELKRRNVFRVAVAYTVVGWLIIQVIDIVLPRLGLPEWVPTLIIVLVLIGLPIAIILAWAFELTPEGVKLEKDVDRTESIAHSTGRKLDFVLIGVLASVSAILALDKFVWTDVSEPNSGAVQQTIAVLPFVNMSDDPEQEYFSDGLSEELLNLLAKIPELRVTSRTSAFSFKGKGATIAEVGQALDVEHVLEGSVRRSGDTIRITAQLIDVATDTHEWSDTWDRNFADVFVIQDEIAESVVSALRIQLLGSVPTVAETTPAAYSLYLRSLNIANNAEAYIQAEIVISRVLAIDPEYVPAWIRLAGLLYGGSSFGAWEPAEAIPRAREALEQALRLDADNAEVHAISARIAIDYDYDYELAEREFKTALQLGSNNPIALSIAASFSTNQGLLEDAVRYIEKMHTIDPLAGWKRRFAETYFNSGRQEEALTMMEENVLLRPGSERINKVLGFARLRAGDFDGALAALDEESSDGHQASGYAIFYEAIGDRERSTEELEKLLALGVRWTYETAQVYSYRGELDEAFLWLDRAIDRRDRSLRELMYDPFMEKLRGDPRFDDVLVRTGRRPVP